MTDEKRSVLIVDDEEDIRFGIEEALKKEYTTSSACDTAQAEELLNKQEFDVALLDIRMPGKSGMDFVPEVKEKYPNIEIIMVTALDDIRIAIECIKRGAYDYISKPFHNEDLVLTIKRALEKKESDRLLKEMEETLQRLEVESQNRKDKLAKLWDDKRAKGENPNIDDIFRIYEE